ncbi:MAG: excinuclease subunit [Cytophagaceae bacterium]|nr:excinuclease subunit [Cytophagaceae bacterium]
MDFFYSESLSKYYVGHTNNLQRRLNDHNKGQSTYTAKGIPWQLIHVQTASSRTEASHLEASIKKRGIERYLTDKSIVRSSRGA